MNCFWIVYFLCLFASFKFHNHFHFSQKLMLFQIVIQVQSWSKLEWFVHNSPICLGQVQSCSKLLWFICTFPDCVGQIKSFSKLEWFFSYLSKLFSVLPLQLYQAAPWKAFFIVEFSFHKCFCIETLSNVFEASVMY